MSHVILQISEYTVSKLSVLNTEEIKDAKCVDMTSGEFAVLHERTLEGRPSIHGKLQ